MIDLTKVIKRLELIRNLISLEENDSISEQISRLKQLQANDEVQEIINILQQKAYSKAVTAIDGFLSKYNQLVLYTDPGIEALHFEVKALEKQVVEQQLIPYRKKDKWGFCTPDKKIVIPCIYDFNGTFREGLAKVKRNGKLGLINKSGQLVIPCIYDEVVDFSDELANVKINENWGFLGKKNGIEYWED